MYELKLERLNVSALVFPEPQSVLVAVILVLMPTLMICYAFPSICKLCHSFNPYRHLCASLRSDRRPPHSSEHHRPIPELDADSECHELLTKDSAPHPPEDATVATSLEHNKVPSSPECVAPEECHKVLSGAPAPEDEVPRSVDSERERSPEVSAMPLTDDPDGLELPGPTNGIASAPETAGSAPYDDTPTLHLEAAEISPKESELSEPTQTEAVELVESAIIPDEAEDQSTEPIGFAAASTLPHPPEEVTSGSEASHSANVPPFGEDDTRSVSVMSHEEPTSSEASLSETTVAEDESPEPQPELDAEVDADDATEGNAHIMQSAFLVDGRDDSGEHPSASTLSQSGCCAGTPREDGDADDDAEWTSVDRMEGRTPRATTPVEAQPPAALTTSPLNKSAVPSPPSHAGDLDIAVTGSVVLLTESEYLHFEVKDSRAQAEPAEREVEEADSTTTSTASTSTTTESSKAKRTPAPLDLAKDVHPGEDGSQRQSTASPSRDPSALDHGSPASPATPRRRMHTPDRPDWALAPSSSDADRAAPKKARRHSCDHPDWAVAPDGDRDAEGASTPSKRKGRKSESDSATSSVTGLGGAASLSGSGSGRGRGKRRTHRGRHSR
ncbi:hypothetical protein L226DRAFT_616922 [Lentinus tigrinus ALCF2SS1-7]|uniref:uncharacterized protein n=1 Tax=Lentinus tigrinus ALCF2SS1-7 TaxID=1328758 RepID=UPI0011662FDE|nr:hypothetical protein L226DRAFT_616922 [Lentinus tigrinus ALCF2SS1-7]